MKNPLFPIFSIIIPTLGERPEMLRKAINGILAQTYPHFEIIVKNGGKPVTDLPQDSRIFYIEKPDKGIADGMNQGMELAHGDIFNESNDDDIMRPETLATVAAELGDHKWCFGMIQTYFGPSGNGWSYEALKKTNIVPQPAAFWTREAYEAVGGMDPTNDLAADYEYWLRLGSKFEPKFIPAILADYTNHPQQLTVRALAQQTADADRVRQKYEGIHNR